MLHITNGSSVALDRSGIGGEIVFWVDVLHEGPVPAGLELEELSRVRAAFLDSQFPNQVSAADVLARRDAALKQFAEHEEVVLWFENDLSGQLQLIQILDWFQGRDTGATRLSLICMGDCTLFCHLRRLVDCPAPLLEEKDGYRVTEAGRDVLAGRADHIQRNGIDRWLGGIHLRGGEPLWRWDERGRRLVTLR